jgi:Uma2 family endonuclease
MSSIAPRRFSLDEYLALEESSQVRHEFFDGEMLAMSGWTEQHAMLKDNLLAALMLKLKGTPCRPMSTDMRIVVEETGFHAYPDLAIVCGERRYTAPNRTTLLNPTVLVEVLSDSTQSYDRRFKVAQYRLIPSLRQIVLIAQDQMTVESFVVTDLGWIHSIYTLPGDELPLESTGIAIPLSEIYDDVELPSGREVRCPRLYNNVMSSVAPRRFSLDEYLALEESSQVRHEFFDGEMLAMSGGTDRHAAIKENLSVNIGLRLKGSECRGRSSDLRVLVQETGFVAYPDYLIVCGSREFLDAKETTLLNPTVLVEVLSDSTQSYDRRFKVAQYRLIPSLRQIVLIAQDQMTVESFVVTDLGWIHSIYTLPGDELPLESTGIAIPLSEIYDDVELDPEVIAPLHEE